MHMVLSNGNTLIQDFIMLFAKMDMLCLTLLLTGLVLCVFELLRPTFKFFFYVGFLLLAGGTVIRMLSGGSLQMLFILIFMIAFLLVAIYFLGITINKSAWLSRDHNNVTEMNEPSVDKEFYFLLNHEGVSSTDIDPSGFIIINDIEFEAFSSVGNIAKDTPIRVIEVENERIVVKPV